MGNLGFEELLLIAIVILVLFGSKKIPDFMKGLGRGVREFNDAKNNVKKELEEGYKETTVRTAPPSANTNVQANGKMEETTTTTTTNQS